MANRTTSARAVAIARSSTRVRKRETSTICLTVSGLRVSTPSAATRSNAVSA